jgi:hypothetical protein
MRPIAFTRIAMIKVNIINTTFLIKAADFFASLPLDTQQPEELAVEVVVHLGAARTSPCTKTPV